MLKQLSIICIKLWTWNLLHSLYTDNSYYYIGPMVRSRSLLVVLLLARDEALELSLELALEGGWEDWRRVPPTPALEGPRLLLLELVLLRGDIPVM